tara:strand:+ start:1695 stop:2480 length:786 start_codon:yes stop_codon:yes gene_type:complete
MRLRIKNIRSLITILSVYHDKRILGRLSFHQKSQFKIYRSFIKELGLKQKTHGHFLFISQNEDIIKQAIKYHYKENKNISLGRLYGYPKCCIKIFSDNQELAIGNNDLGILLKAFENSQSNIFSIYTNWFSRHKLILHLPHSFDCGPSVKIGRQNLEILREYDKKLFNLAVKELNACILEYKGNILALSNFILEKERVKLGLKFWLNNLPILVNNVVLGENLKTLSFWANILSSFKDGESYNVGFNNDQGIKVMVFSNNEI